MKQYAYPNEHWPLSLGDLETGLMSADEALQDWITGLDIDLPAEIWESTRWDHPAEFNLAALDYACQYHGINLDAMGYPLPRLVSSETQ